MAQKDNDHLWDSTSIHIRKQPRKIILKTTHHPIMISLRCQSSSTTGKMGRIMPLLQLTRRFKANMITKILTLLAHRPETKQKLIWLKKKLSLNMHSSPWGIHQNMNLFLLSQKTIKLINRQNKKVKCPYHDCWAICRKGQKSCTRFTDRTTKTINDVSIPFNKTKSRHWWNILRMKENWLQKNQVISLLKKRKIIDLTKKILLNSNNNTIF